MCIRVVASGMRFRNHRGRDVDPVPFLVVASLAFLLSYSYIPITLMELGLSLVLALSVTTCGFCAVSALAYYRLVWTANPDIRAEIPVETRLKTILYVMLVAIGILALLGLLAATQ